MCIFPDTGPNREEEEIYGFPDIGNKPEEVLYGFAEDGDKTLEALTSVIYIR